MVHERSASKDHMVSQPTSHKSHSIEGGIEAQRPSLDGPEVFVSEYIGARTCSHTPKALVHIIWPNIFFLITRAIHIYLNRTYK